MTEPGPERATPVLPEALMSDPGFRHMLTLVAGRLCQTAEHVALIEALCAFAFAHGSLCGTRELVTQLRTDAAIAKAKAGD